MKLIMPILISCFMLLAGCKPTPEPITYGQDGCAFCKMTIVDQRYAAELVTNKGKVYKFDAVECMINYINENKDVSFAHTLVSPFDDDKLKDAATCYYLRSEKLPSPMGMYITALSNKQTAEEFADRYEGTVYSWAELKAQFNRLPDFNPQALN